MEYLNYLKLLITQNPGTLIGLILFSSSLLVFLAKADPEVSAGRLSLWAILFLSGGLLIGHALVVLYTKLRSLIIVIRRNRILNNPQAIQVLMKIKDVGNQILNDPLFQSGLASPVDLNEIATDLKLPYDDVRYFVFMFRQFNWLIINSEDGDIWGVSDYGLSIMHKKKLT